MNVLGMYLQRVRAYQSRGYIQVISKTPALRRSDHDRRFHQSRASP
jgi:hypothetical protein